MSYLQVVGEQHHQVETHMAAFSNRMQELCEKHNLLLPGAVEVRGTVGKLASTLTQRTGSESSWVRQQQVCR